MKKSKMRSKLAILLACSAFFIANSCLLFGGDFEGEYEDAKMSSVEFASKLTVGWNLGNTLDAEDSNSGKTNKGLVTETSWGMPTTTKEMIDAIAAKGFKTIRIPVSWHNHIVKSDNIDYEIDSKWMARVKEIVQWALDDNMYVIINIHHDNLTTDVMKNAYGYCVDQNPNVQALSKNYIVSVWKQIATEFASYDNRVVFEILNEPRYRNGSNDGFTTPSDLASYNKIISKYETAAINAIRGIPGNENRFVMVPFYAANPYSSSGWTVPTDTATDKLLISVHAYNPYPFAMYDGSEHTVFSDADKKEIEWLYTMLKNDWISKGYGVIMGEASASDKKNDEERRKWIQANFGSAKKNDIPIILWDNMATYSKGGNLSEFHGWFNRNNLSWYFDSLVNEMINISTR